jgi:hypothetical protein
MHEALPGDTTRCVAAGLATSKGAETFLAQVPDADILVNNLGTAVLHDFGATTDQDWLDPIHALSTAHDVLLQQNWTAAPVQAVAEQVLGALGQMDRIDLCGPDISLSPRSALSFATLHEMGTNAVKYGALSNEIGRVSLSWGISGEGLEAEMALRWREHADRQCRCPRRPASGPS